MVDAVITARANREAGDAEAGAVASEKRTLFLTAFIKMVIFVIGLRAGHVSDDSSAAGLVLGGARAASTSGCKAG